MQEVEHKLQKAIVEYLEIRRICYWAVPNGGHRKLSVAKKMKAEGVKAGVPDITIIHDGKYYGIEIKKPKTQTPKGYLSPIQRVRIQQIEKAGGKVGVAYSVDDVYQLLEDWKIK